MATNSFSPRKYEDHTIVDGNGRVVGHVRLKPNTILWSAKNEKGWHGISLDDFAEFVQTKGKKQKK